MIPAAHVAALKAGELTGSDLADDIDGKLVGAVMSAEGRAFRDAGYGAYTAAFEAAFRDHEPYSVGDDDAARLRIDPILEDLYAGWVAAGRPAMVSTLDDLPLPMPSDERAAFDAATFEINVADLPRQHHVPDLETSVPADLSDPPMEVTSVRATEWGSSLLRRSLKRLGVRPADVVVVDGLGGSGEETLVVALFAVPGIDRLRLLDEFRSVIFIPRGAWQTRVVAGRAVQWMTVPEFSTAFWANDGLVVQVSGRADLVEAAIPRLP
jgi:hypothetical protein